MKCAAVLLGAGRGTRLGFDKILTPLAGKPVILYALEALLKAPSVERIVVTTRSDVLQPMQELIQSTAPSKPVDVIIGGTERQDSVALGLEHLGEKAKIALIHDGARPLLSVDMIECSIAAAQKHGAVVCAQKASDTLKRANAEAMVEETLDRSKIWQIQTPQVFRTELILKAYRHVQQNKLPITDDASAVETLDHPVWLVETNELNLKITREMDWKFLELWLGQGEQGNMNEVRKLLHDVCNLTSPLTGYMPLLEKYGGNDPKFLQYFEKVRNATSAMESKLKALQQVVGQLSSKN